MIRITEEAGRYLLRLLEERNPSLQGESCFRIPDSVALVFELALDTKVKGDVALTHEGRTVLALDPKVAERCQNMTLDIVEKGDGTPELVLVETPSRSANGNQEE